MQTRTARTSGWILSPPFRAVRGAVSPPVWLVRCTDSLTPRSPSLYPKPPPLHHSAHAAEQTGPPVRCRRYMHVYAYGGHRRVLCARAGPLTFPPRCVSLPYLTFLPSRQLASPTISPPSPAPFLPSPASSFHSLPLYPPSRPLRLPSNPLTPTSHFAPTHRSAAPPHSLHPRSIPTPSRVIDTRTRAPGAFLIRLCPRRVPRACVIMWICAQSQVCPSFPGVALRGAVVRPWLCHS